MCLNIKFVFTFQTIPRTVLFDNKTGTNLLLWPVEEIESLRLSSDEYEEIVIEPGSVVPLNISQATQVLPISSSKLLYH
jgi:beta-fructofuranosidase